MSVGIPGSPRSRAVTVSAGDSASVDAFGRWRVSEPQTLFDSKLIFNDSDLADNVENHPLIYDNQEISGGGTSTAYIANQSAQSGSSGSSDKGIDNAIRLGSTIAGVTDTLVLCARPIGGSSNTDIEGSITWREIV